MVERVLGTDRDVARVRRAAAAVPWLAPLVARCERRQAAALSDAVGNGGQRDRLPASQHPRRGRDPAPRDRALRHPGRTSTGSALSRSRPRRRSSTPTPTSCAARGSRSTRSWRCGTSAARSSTATLDEAGLALLPTPELTAALVEQRGIGPWTAAVIALRGFGRLDVFPMNDSGVAKGLRDLTGQPDVDVPALLARPRRAARDALLPPAARPAWPPGERWNWLQPPPGRREHGYHHRPRLRRPARRRPGVLRLRLAARRTTASASPTTTTPRTSTGARCACSTTTPCCRGRASAPTRTATWRSSPTCCAASSSTRTRWGTTASSRRAASST